MTTARRMTPDELDAAAARLLPADPPMPPLPVAVVLEAITMQTRNLQADLWTLRDAIDADLEGPRLAAALEALAELAGYYDDAADTARTLAAELGTPLADIHYGPSSC